MIGRLRGTLAEVDGALAVVDCGGVGYEVLLPESVLLRLPDPGQPVDLLTRQVFREDSVTLYGFLGTFQRKLFDLLMGVKGCGPRIGLALIGQLGEETVASAIVAQDARSLARATGVGPRLAERIILELKEKVGEIAFQRRVEGSAGAGRTKTAPADELVDALLALGYRRTEAEVAAEAAKANAEGVEEQLRFALRSLQR